MKPPPGKPPQVLPPQVLPPQVLPPQPSWPGVQQKPLMHEPDAHETEGEHAAPSETTHAPVALQEPAQAALAPYLGETPAGFTLRCPNGVTLEVTCR